MTNEEKIQKLNEIVKGSDNIVFFGGAGVSTESGIPDFRSQDGLYHQQYDYPPEEILSHTFYETMPEEFFRFYKNKILLPGANAKPNAAHKKLAQWEQAPWERAAQLLRALPHLLRCRLHDSRRRCAAL